MIPLCLQGEVMLSQGFVYKSCSIQTHAQWPYKCRDSKLVVYLTKFNDISARCKIPCVFSHIILMETVWI